MKTWLVAGALVLGVTGAAGLVLAQETQPAASPPSASQPPPSYSPGEPAISAAPPSMAAPPPEEPASAVPPPVAPLPPVVEAEPEGPPPPPPPPPEPLKRPRLGAAVLQAVDKITAETLRFEARVGEPVRFKGLVITVRACETTAADEPDFDSMAHLDVQSRPEGVAGRAPVPARTVFRGWTFASSPALNPFAHPVYDLWLIACKAAAPVA